MRRWWLWMVVACTPTKPSTPHTEPDSEPEVDPPLVSSDLGVAPWRALTLPELEPMDYGDRRSPYNLVVACPVEDDGSATLLALGRQDGHAGAIWRFDGMQVTHEAYASDVPLETDPDAYSQVLLRTDAEPRGVSCLPIRPGGGLQVQLHSFDSELSTLVHDGQWRAEAIVRPDAGWEREPRCDQACAVADLDGNGLPDLILAAPETEQEQGRGPGVYALQTAPGVFEPPVELTGQDGVQQSIYVAWPMAERSVGPARWSVAMLGKLIAGGPHGVYVQPSPSSLVFTPVDPTEGGSRFEAWARLGDEDLSGRETGLPLSSVTPMGMAEVMVADPVTGDVTQRCVVTTAIGGELAMHCPGDWGEPGGWRDVGSTELSLPLIRWHGQEIPGTGDDPCTPWFVGPVDLDRDGDDDLLVTCGDDDGSFRAAGTGGAFEPAAGREPTSVLAYENHGWVDGRLRWTRWSDGGAVVTMPPEARANALGDLARVENRRTCTLADLQADGDPDLLCGGFNRPEIFLNEVDNGAGSVSFRLVGDGVDDDHLGTGARVVVVRSDGVRIDKSPWSYAVPGARGEGVVFFGLGSAEVDRVEVHWRSGVVSEHPGPFPAGGSYRLRR